MSRKAWNDAMRSAAGVSALPPALQPRTNKRRSDRRKKDRREKARKVQSLGDEESKEVLAAAWMDALEDIAPSGPAADDDDSYDELEELEGEKKKRRRTSTKKAASAGVLPKRFKPRSLANVLLEEVNREDGVARAWLENEARRKDSDLPIPVRKFCPVSGLEGIYTEPKSRIPYANLKALEQIQERPPPWMTLSGTLAYHEAVASIRDES
eukprot:scaffold6159_cov207-Cylindrotheca_fusiformis.AAC.7